MPANGPNCRIRRRARDIQSLWAIRWDPTYRRLAKTYELPDGSRRIYCYHVRKTAGTSLYLSFLALGGEDPMDVWRRITASRLPRTVSGHYSFVSNNRRLLAEGAYFYGRSHRAAADQPLPPKTFTVTVLRIPWSGSTPTSTTWWRATSPAFPAGWPKVNGVWPGTGSTPFWTGSRPGPVEPVGHVLPGAGAVRGRRSDRRLFGRLFRRGFHRRPGPAGTAPRPAPVPPTGPGDRQPGPRSATSSASGSGRGWSPSTSSSAVWTPAGSGPRPRAG